MPQPHKKLHAAFSEALARIEVEFGVTESPLNSASKEMIAIDYFIAIEQLIERSNPKPLQELMESKTQPPPELLPVLSDLIKSPKVRTGPKPTLTSTHEIYLTLVAVQEMNKDGSLLEFTLEKVSTQLKEEGINPTTRHLHRIFDAHKSNPFIQRHLPPIKSR